MHSTAKVAAQAGLMHCWKARSVIGVKVRGAEGNVKMQNAEY